MARLRSRWSWLPGSASRPRKDRRWLALLAIFLVLVGPAHAVQPDEILPDPVLEARARALSRELRCMVCQNESIDDSNAQLARDLRVLVRERLTAGDSDAAVRDFLVARYGDFVLLRPRFSGATVLLWASPFLVLALGAAGMILATRRRRRAQEPVLTEDEERRIAEIVASDPAATGERNITQP